MRIIAEVLFDENVIEKKADHQEAGLARSKRENQIDETRIKEGRNSFEFVIKVDKYNV